MNSPRYKAFIQSNNKQLIGAELAKYSLISNSQHPADFDVEIMLVEKLPQMLKYEGQAYFKGKNSDKWTVNDLQSFTMTRFLPASLMNFQGKALVIDPDVFATPGTDIMELFEKDMKGKAILACSADNNKFKSSVMLLDCEKLRAWSWDKDLEDVFSGKKDYRAWMNLQLEPNGSVGVLEDEWNHCDTLTDKTKLIHYTRRVTQPWKTGLKVDFKYDIPTRYWYLPKVFLRWLKKIQGGNNIYHARYQQNPSIKQEDFFFNLLKKALEQGALQESFIRQCVRDKHVRPDILKKNQE